MVAVLGLGKFYGSSLPRPRFVKLKGERVDPPLPVMDPLLAWAKEAHWSMGGASMKRLRLQGRIEGNVNKLRVQRETLFKKSGKHHKSVSSPAPRVITRRRVVELGQNFGRVVGKGGGMAAGKKRSERREVDLVVVEGNGEPN